MSTVEITKDMNDKVKDERHLQPLDKDSMIEYKGMLLQYKIIVKAIRDGKIKFGEDEKLDAETKEKTFEFLDYCYDGFKSVSTILERVINQKGMYEEDEEEIVKLTDKFKEELPEKSMDYLAYMIENDKIDDLGSATEVVKMLQSIGK